MITIWQRMFDTVVVAALLVGAPLAVKYFLHDMWQEYEGLGEEPQGAAEQEKEQ